MTGLPVPRVGLAGLPTPLVDAPRLAAALGMPSLLVKRDDLTGFAVEGNKARQLEPLLTEALDRRADVLVTGGSIGSNFIATNGQLFTIISDPTGTLNVNAFNAIGKVNGVSTTLSNNSTFTTAAGQAFQVVGAERARGMAGDAVADEGHPAGDEAHDCALGG